MINNTSVENNHITNGNLATVYPITFQGATDDNGLPMLKVTLVTADESSHRELEYNVDYVLSYDEVQENNSESLNEPHLNGIKLLNQEDATSGNKLSIIRNTPFVQPIDFQVGRIDPEQVEKEADLSVLRDQELRNQMTKDEAILADHEERITGAEEDIDNIEDTLAGHMDNHDNPHQTSVTNLTDTQITNPTNGHLLRYDGTKWVNSSSDVTSVDWGEIEGNIADQADLQLALSTKVNLDGTSIMTAPLKFLAGSMRGAVGPYLNGVSFWKMSSQHAITNIANLTDSQFLPVTTNSIDIGRTANAWKDLYLDGKAYVATLNNGADITVPTTSGTLALLSDVPAAQVQSDWSQADNTAVDYIKNKPTIPAAQVNADWDAVSGVAQILNKPALATVATSGSYTDLQNTPTIPTVGDGTITITQGGTTKGTFTVNQSGNTTIELDAGGSSGGADTIDAEIVGTLTITNNSSVSGFGAGNYLKFPSELDFPNNFEIGCAFSTTDISSAVVCFVRGRARGITIWITASKLQAQINTQIINGATTLSSNTKYYVKLTSDGVNYTLSLSTDGVNYTQEVTAAITDTPETSDYMLGAASTNATLYMQDYYIKQNGVLVWTGCGASGLHQRVAKGHEVIEFQKPTSNNNYTWYRKYADGWVEQGGVTGSGVGSVTLPITMADDNYTIVRVQNFTSGTQSNYPGWTSGVATKTTTGFTFNHTADSSCWEVKGIAA